jgi:mono/diheme cytochrome c family protein
MSSPLNPLRPLALFALGLVSASAAEAPANFQKNIRPLLEQHCFKCHNAEKHKGGIDLTPFDSEGAVLKKYKLWQRVIEQIETQEMPPDDDKFTAQHGTMVVQGVKNTLALLESGHPALLDPGPSIARRLSHLEYTNAIRALTRLDLDIAQKGGLPSDSTGSSYENIAAALQVPPALLEKYFTATDIVLDRLFGPLPEAPKTKPVWQSDAEIAKIKAQRTQFFASVPADADRAVTQKFVAQFTRLAWRRPAVTAEIERLMKVYDAALAKGDTPRTALRRTLKPVLVASDFLFRIEDDRTPKAPAAGTRVPAAKVDDIELASRLSFFLWSSIPDEELLTLAEKKQLSKPETLAEQVKRMLADPKAKELTENFFVRWLGANRVAQARPATEAFPAFNDGMKKAMLAEVTAFCDNLRTEDRPLLDLLNADYTFANADLAKLYGLAGVTSKEFQRVALKPENHRGGVLGMGAILASTSHTDRTSPTQRGKWVLDVIFGTPPAPPPANASQFKDDGKKKAAPKDFREKMAQHAADASCAGCHKRMDPLGFGLDNFDAIGTWRPSSATLDTSGELPGGEKFNGAEELKKIIWSKREQFTRNLVAQMLTYALGRELDYFDESQISRIKTGVDKAGGKFSALTLGVVNSYPFQYRRNADPQPDAPAKTAANS